MAIIQILKKNDNLYLGHWVDAKKAYDDKENYELFTMAANSRFESMEHYYPLVDGKNKDNEKLLHFALWDLFLERISSEKKILIHCSKGLSRAVTTGMAFMIAFKGYNFVDAYQHIEKLKSVIYQDFHLEELVLKIEQEQQLQKMHLEDRYGREYSVEEKFYNWEEISSKMILIAKAGYNTGCKIIEAYVPYVNETDMLIKIQNSGIRDLNGVKDLRIIEQEYNLERAKLFPYPTKIIFIPITSFDKDLCECFLIDKKEKYEGDILGESDTYYKIHVEGSEWVAWIKKDNFEKIIFKR